ncbi:MULTISPECIES: helix-turn-helix transcriptional regulator [unclassified Mycobacterium]|uniref:helix-turn-helix transcriptional regulator n=1 Tax=unclassified Mycobacterium TaxID=2642494 RepID=UPI0029C609DD|nr:MULTISPECIES: helix-turn-helix domain-containing protein [unclassified Mycobacterium]
MGRNRPDHLVALEGLSSLGDPLRQRLYQYVADSDASVSRDVAASAVGIGRTLAAYHLDKLVDAGLLTVSYQRPEGRGGPGAGRPAKLYAPATQELTVSVPPRDYELLARLLVASLEQDGGGTVRAAVNGAAFEAGRRAGGETAGSLVGALRACGYLPQAVGEGRINLRNCPFHLVAQDHRDVVCGLNLRLVEGVIAGCDQPNARAELDPDTDRCCVVVHDATPSHRPG